MSEFLKILGDCEEDNISDVAAAFAELKSSGILLAAEESLLDHRLGQLGGPALFAGDLPSSGSGEEIARLKSRYNGWMQADPAAAKLWLDGLPPGKSRDQMLVAYISASAAGDPEGALREAATLPEVLKGQAGRSVAERLVQTGSMEEVSMLLSGLEERGDGSERYLGGIFDELLNGAVKNGVDPASLVERHFDQPYVNYSTLAKVSEQKAKADPVAALEWAAGLEGRKEGVPDGGVLAAALGGMKLEDLDQAEEWALANAGRAGVESLLPFLQRQREALDGKGTDDDYDFDRDE